MWSKEKIDNHIEAAKRLDKTMADTFEFIKARPKTTEYDVQQFILKELKKHKIKNEVFTPIVAFGPNTAHVHYHPSQYSRVLKPGMLILVDIWGRINKRNAPYADMTWMGYAGAKNVKHKTQHAKKKEMEKLVNEIFKARDKALDYVKREIKKGRMPTGKEIDAVARELIDPAGTKARKFLHGLGHELGFKSPHGLGRPISPKNKFPIKKNMGYTIEPGAYIPGKFGARSEISFYINNKGQVILTTKLQKRLVKI